MAHGDLLRSGSKRHQTGSDKTSWNWLKGPKCCLTVYDLYDYILFKELKHQCVLVKANHCHQWRIQDFPEEGAPTPGGRQPMILSIFAENCMKMKKFWPGGGGGRTSPAPPLDPPMVMPPKSGDLRPPLSRDRCCIHNLQNE